MLFYVFLFCLIVLDPARIIEFRFISPQGQAVGRDIEYYVHYKNYDRRLDEWVSGSRVISNKTQAQTGKKTQQRGGKSNGAVLTVASASGTSSLENMKMTRNQKRRHDEINHIQTGIEEMDPITAAMEREREAKTNV